MRFSVELVNMSALSKKLSYLELLGLYIQPWTRFGPYAIGIALGMIMYRTKCRVHMPKSVVIVGWLFSFCVSSAAMYGGYGLTGWSGARHAYMAMCRNAFALGIGWLVFACCTGYGGFVKRFLSWNVFIPFSRLTYTLYLIHPLIIYGYTYGRNQLIYVQYSTMMMLFLAYWLLGNMSASVLSACFELPFMELERVIFSRRRT
ncbi:O-acyltransferase like protein [Lamellibrachia satsuma]|nr:O-acyltransferase like protein [Lamellibrachia satsuma]